MRMRIGRGTLAWLIVAASACAPQGGSGTSDGTGTVGLKEWAIQPATIEVKAGKVTLQVKNTGNIEHNFDVPGVAKIDSIVAGDTKTFEAELRPGTYEVVCSLPGHKEAGMVGKLVVK